MKKNKSILICDDDRGILDATKMILEEKGYSVFLLDAKENIFRQIEKIKPMLILLDIWLGEINGEEVANRLKKNKKTQKIKIIILSANRLTKEIATRIKAEDYITKPYDIEELEKKVEKALT